MCFRSRFFHQMMSKRLSKSGRFSLIFFLWILTWPNSPRKDPRPGQCIQQKHPISMNLARFAIQFPNQNYTAMFSTFFAHYIVHHYSVVYDGCYDVGVQKMTGSAEAAKQFFLANNCVVVVVVVVGIIKNEIFKLLYLLESIF